MNDTPTEMSDWVGSVLHASWNWPSSSFKNAPSTRRQEFGTLDMAITEQNRRDIFNGLETTLGSDVANHLMELLPNSPANELVTRTDMHAFGSELRGEMAELRGEMSELRGQFHVDMSKLRVDMQRLVGAGMAANTIAVVTALLI